MNDFPVLDKETALSRLANNHSLYNKVLVMFTEQAGEMLTVLEALPQDQIADQHLALHSLKGSAGEVGATRLFYTLQQIDQTLKTAPEHVTADQIEDVIAEIRRILNITAPGNPAA
ncbi:Hpt domain-containing protein [Alteromonas sp. RKMC-009]|uniref:Hpt domain-containing protein n=1 Tax=Alteromonas sp. RKMC-009 TaxID=2267264 RepID=UPI000E6921D0|nr:Hpt domain-containing protein [Alteromonas sp. RKMC-009]AYA65751.1 Hpt domain-containing protein [Alteromonas sp. RKMC-009]